MAETPGMVCNAALAEEYCSAVIQPEW
jgi:hypothetical protein